LVDDTSILDSGRKAGHGETKVGVDWCYANLTAAYAATSSVPYKDWGPNKIQAKPPDSYDELQDSRAYCISPTGTREYSEASLVSVSLA